MVQRVKNSFIEWIAARMQERTTAAGLAAVLAWAGIHFEPNLVHDGLLWAGSALIFVNSSR